MGILFIFISSILTALANLFIRKSMDASSSSGGDPFLFQRFLGAGVMSFIIAFLIQGKVGFETKMVILGLASGLILGLMQWSLGRSVKNGPAALSFTFAGAACVVPPLAMFLAFGHDFGHDYSIWNGVGSILVIAGLFWMGFKQAFGEEIEKRQLPIWIFWTIIAFSINALYQTFFQWRALMLKENNPESALLPFSCDPAYGDCFVIVMFLTAAAIQLLLSGRSSLQKVNKPMLLFGVGGGFLNGLAGFALMRSTEICNSATEKALIFPLLSVSIILLCNLWGRFLYQERICWTANFLCVVGIAISR